MTAADQRHVRSVFVVGATGGVGRLLARRLVERGSRVSGLHREEDGAAVSELGAEPVRGDLVDASVEDLADRLRGHDAVVFCAGGGGGEATDVVDRAGAIKTMDAALAAGVRRFALVSVFMDAWRGDESPGEGFENYISAKRAADVHLAATDLDFLIVRPGSLTDDDGTGRVNAGVSVAYAEISRDDVAAFIAAALFSPGLTRVAVELTRGDRPVNDAVQEIRAGSPTS